MSSAINRIGTTKIGNKCSGYSNLLAKTLRDGTKLLDFFSKIKDLNFVTLGLESIKKTNYDTVTLSENRDQEGRTLRKQLKRIIGLVRSVSVKAEGNSLERKKFKL